MSTLFITADNDSPRYFNFETVTPNLTLIFYFGLQWRIHDFPVKVEGTGGGGGELGLQPKGRIANLLLSTFFYQKSEWKLARERERPLCTRIR